jgi:hypothetical protein
LNKEKLKKLAADPQFISGIYNYCDRWCERCNFTSKCLNYATAGRDNLTPEEQDFTNEAFWVKMGEIFSLTRELIEDSARELGIDPEEIDPEDIENEERCFDEACGHALTQMAEDYSSKAKIWLENSSKLLNEKEIEFFDRVSLGIETDKIDGEASSIRDALDVIMYYLFFIQAKVIRALHGKIEGVPEEIEYMPKDSDGSAKVAIISIERTMSAWAVLLQIFTKEEDFILSILAHLKRLHNRMLDEFPDAMAFVRPGFDE